MWKCQSGICTAEVGREHAATWINFYGQGKWTATAMLCDLACSKWKQLEQWRHDRYEPLIIPAMNEMAQYIELALVELSSLRRYWADHELDTGRAEWTRRAA